MYHARGVIGEQPLKVSQRLRKRQVLPLENVGKGGHLAIPAFGKGRAQCFDVFDHLLYAVGGFLFTVSHVECVNDAIKFRDLGAEFIAFAGQGPDADAPMFNIVTKDLCVLSFRFWHALGIGNGRAQFDLKFVERIQGLALAAFVAVIAGRAECGINGADLFVGRFGDLQEGFHRSILPSRCFRFEAALAVILATATAFALHDPARCIHATVVALVAAWIGLVLDRAIALDPLAGRAVVTTNVLAAPVIDLGELQGGAVCEVCEVLNVDHDHLPCFDGQILAEGRACVNRISMICTINFVK